MWAHFPFGLVFGTLLLTAVFAAGLLLAAPSSTGLRSLVTYLLGLDTTKATWYITRSAGVTAYLLLWLSVVWGLALPTRLLDGWLGRAFTFDFHQVISLLALGFTGLHIVVLLFDSYLPFNFVQLLVPFLSPYRPIWVGLGSLALYISILVTVTFYLRRRMIFSVFRAIHTTSLLAFLGAALHGLFAGTDSALPAAQFMYLGTFLVVVFLTAYWLIARRASA
jgi:methionine sulfoxide reductase heme-binding subunit